MSKQYRLVVFDWEGTLGDSLGQILNCVSKEARRLQFGEIDEALARRSVSLGLVHACKKMFPHLDSSQLKNLLDAVQYALMSRNAEERLFTGAKELVQKLHARGVGLAIATNKGAQSLRRSLYSTGLDAYFKVTRAAGQAPPKPCPQMLEDILKEYGLSVEEAVMIGDSEGDIRMAQSIGMDALGVHFYDQEAGGQALLNAGAIKVFKDYQSIADFLDGLR